MENFHVLFLSVFFSFSLFHGGIARAVKSQGGSEEWGYVQVRPKAHMFWWLYRSPYRVEQPSKPWPIILWLQGGPGSSGVGIGNFEEIGPLDTYMNPRNSTWLKKADLLFVDNPVGTGYSFVEDPELLVKTEDEAATDLTTLLMELFNSNESLQKSPLFIFAESYGGKFGVTSGVSILKAIEAGKLKLKLGGVALGNTWISPEDFVVSWGPLLNDVSRIDNNALEKSNSLAKKISQQLKDGQYAEATNTWIQLMSFIEANSNTVDFYNFLKDLEPEHLTASPFANGIFAVNRHSRYQKKYSRYLSSLRVFLGRDRPDLVRLMNGVIKKKLKIIPANVSWGVNSADVSSHMVSEFMKPRIAGVDELLSKGINVTVYNGQLDVACATKGAEAWVSKLKWEGLQDFLSKERTPLYCKDDEATKGFIRTYKNLQFYWILGAGHLVPIGQPCVALNMAGAITQSPAAEDF
ncbi:serine carboxypeptidase-like 51 [Durio zibethinus]|uniref:Carboxypeptidase n=1 Tax=Durio zibethinus TaxID=66656 RepID=A0A6P5ZPB5_DURZI|nr:serine carboxypeptidase-like 51 [Durio zibethinus]